MGLVPYQGVDVPPEQRWSFCGEPYSFEKYLTFCVEQLDDTTRSEMAQLGLLGYQFKHILPLHHEDGTASDGYWLCFYHAGAYTTLVNNAPRLHDCVMSAMAWHITKEIEADVKRANAAQFGKAGFAR